MLLSSDKLIDNENCLTCVLVMYYFTRVSTREIVHYLYITHLYMSHFSRFWISREKPEKRIEFLTRNEKKLRKILPYKMRENWTWNLGLILFLTRKMMSKPFFILLCLKEFGTLKNHKKSAKIRSKMKKLISHFSYLNFSYGNSSISRFSRGTTTCTHLSDDNITFYMK